MPDYKTCKSCRNWRPRGRICSFDGKIHAPGEHCLEWRDYR